MLTTAVKAARRAGNVITRGARDLDLLTVTTKGPKDFVSEVDRAAEASIVETLLGAYPDHAIHAEEGTERGRNPDEHVGPKARRLSGPLPLPPQHAGQERGHHQSAQDDEVGMHGTPPAGRNAT